MTGTRVGCIWYFAFKLGKRFCPRKQALPTTAWATKQRQRVELPTRLPAKALRPRASGFGPLRMHGAETANLAHRQTKQSFQTSAGRAPAAEGRAARADMADAAERPIDQHCLDYFATNSAEHLTFELSGWTRAQPLARPLERRVRRRQGWNRPSLRSRARRQKRRALELRFHGGSLCTTPQMRDSGREARTKPVECATTKR
jgi:hypothetical protein